MTRSTEPFANARTNRAKKRPILAVNQRLRGGADPATLAAEIAEFLGPDEFENFTGTRTGRKLQRLVAVKSAWRR